MRSTIESFIIEYNSKGYRIILETRSQSENKERDREGRG